MQAVRKNSVVVEPQNIEEVSVNGLITSGFDGFEEGIVVSSAYEGIKEGDVVIYEDALTIGEYKVVFEGNIIAKK